MILAYVLADTCSYLLEEPLGEYHKLETLKIRNIYISAYQAIIGNYMTLRNTEFLRVCFMKEVGKGPERGSNIEILLLLILWNVTNYPCCKCYYDNDLDLWRCWWMVKYYVTFEDNNEGFRWKTFNEGKKLKLKVGVLQNEKTRVKSNSIVKMTAFLAVNIYKFLLTCVFIFWNVYLQL